MSKVFDAYFRFTVCELSLVDRVFAIPAGLWACEALKEVTDT